jgi:hypothetical protein
MPLRAFTRSTDGVRVAIMKVSCGLLVMLALLGITPPASAQDEQAASSESEEVDDVRFRGGFLIGGGPYIVPGTDLVGGGGMLNFRLGVQINHIFSVYYQGQGMAGVLVERGGGAAALASVYNNVMAGFTLLHFLDLGVGPSVDILAAAVATTSGGGTGALVAPGANARVAFNLGFGPDEGESRRSGFSIGADVHPMFLDGGVLMSFTVGIGAEWY